MSTDLETTIAEALDAGTDEAPSTAGLAAGARRRARTRRRRRGGTAVLAAGLVAALLVVGVPALRGDGPDTARDDVPSATARDGWHSVTLAGITTEVPPGWEEISTPAPICGFVEGEGAIAPGDDPCGGPRLSGLEGVLVLDYSDVDVYGGWGAIDRYEDDSWVGFVSVGDSEYVLRVASPDRDVVRDVLAAARPAGEPAPDLSAGWEEVEAVRGTVRVQEPMAWAEPAAGEPRYGVRPVTTGTDTQLPFQRRDGDWDATSPVDGLPVRVVAPTEALVQVVLGSARPVD